MIGGGPAGLTAAYFLAIYGHEATLFEAQEVMGGTTYLGIPAYRLPREVIEAEVDAIAEAGVDIQTGKALGRDFTLDELKAQGYDAVFLGIGAHEGYTLGIEGEQDFPQVHGRHHLPAQCFPGAPRALRPTRWWWWAEATRPWTRPAPAAAWAAR